jgi:hypothetical protein
MSISSRSWQLALARQLRQMMDDAYRTSASFSKSRVLVKRMTAR